MRTGYSHRRARARLNAGRVIRSDPAVAAVLEKELKRPGDVMTILEERDGFEVFRLVEVTTESWVEAVRFPKLDFDSWLERQRGRVARTRGLTEGRGPVLRPVPGRNVDSARVAA